MTLVPLFQKFKNWRVPLLSLGIPAVEWIEFRKKVRRRFKGLFDPSELANLTREDFSSFLNFKVNKSWTGLHRHKTKVTKDMQRLRNAIAYLQDESVDIGERINELLSRDGKYKVDGMGPNLTTAILHICDRNDNYGVWNNRSESALEKLKLFKGCIGNKGEYYLTINRLLCELKNKLHTDLVTIDSFMYYVDTILENSMPFCAKMDYKKLLAASEKFKELENKASYYEEYMNNKLFRLWETSADIPKIEIMKLFGFVLSWDRNFEGDLAKFERAYHDLYPLIRDLQYESLDNIDFNEATKVNIQEIFDRVANSTLTNRYESTDASKIIHTIIPKLFVMWDRKIREGIWAERNWNPPVKFSGKEYASEFLPLMQEKANEVIESYIRDKHCSRDKAIAEMSKLENGKSIAKMLDEYNYVKYTLGMGLNK